MVEFCRRLSSLIFSCPADHVVPDHWQQPPSITIYNSKFVGINMVEGRSFNVTHRTVVLILYTSSTVVVANIFKRWNVLTNRIRVTAFRNTVQ